MEDTTMKKQEYMKPEMQVVEITQSAPLLAGSSNGLNDQLQDETVEYGW
jgi:hypothetical protein